MYEDELSESGLFKIRIKNKESILFEEKHILLEGDEINDKRV